MNNQLLEHRLYEKTFFTVDVSKAFLLMLQSSAPELNMSFKNGGLIL